MKTLITGIFGIFLLAGCAAKQYYMISAPHQIDQREDIGVKVIGVETVEIPSYLSQGKVAVLKEGNRIVYLNNILWAVDMREDLTNALIFDLQKSLPQCSVFHYPWDGTKKTDTIIKVKISRFIAYKGYVYLDALVRVNQKDKVLSFKVQADTEDPVQIVEGMKKAFFRLEREVIGLLDNIKISKKQR